MTRARARAAATLLAAAVASATGCGAADASAGEPAAGSGPSAADAPARWTWPVSPPRVVEPFQAPPGPYAAGHRGIDLAAAGGTHVVAPSAGVLTVAQTVVDRPVVTIKVSAQVLVSMEPVVANVPVGATVARGQNLGEVGSGGHCDGRCIHLGVRVDGEYVSPLLFFAGVPAAVLLPVE